MDLVYICSPYRGDKEKNTENVKRYCRMAEISNKIPIAPHLYFTTFLDDDTHHDRFIGMYMGKQLLTLCKEMWVIADEVSEGMLDEINEAKKLGIKLVFMDSELKEVTYENYFINTRLGEGFKRVIEDAHRDSERAGKCARCGKCECRSGHGAESGKKPRKGFWSRFFGIKG